MTDREAIVYIKELMDYNKNNQMITPRNEKFDVFYQCAFENAIKALRERGT